MNAKPAQKARKRQMSERELVQVILDAAEAGSWNAAAWILERRYPDRWLKMASRPAPAESKEPDDPFEGVIELAKRRG